MSEIPKAYEPDKVEQKWYQFWMDQGYFKPRIDPAQKPFVIIMPPPNVTGMLHLGHALTATLEDILIRWHRMKGEPTLWLPGVDHAGIATQVVVEQKLLKEGIDRHALGREKFVEEVWKWVAESRESITLQHKRLGASCDWTRECFTLDEGPSLAVRTAFVNLFSKGLIYRGERIITWCPRCQTALSDLEVQHKEITGNIYYMRYPLADETGFITVATTRPETYLGDTAVAVHPDDSRFKQFKGKSVTLPIIGRTIPIITDHAIDPTFGTGAVKITPYHDPVDFEVAERHHLPMINILNPNATLNENAGPYMGMDRFEARQKILEDFEKQELLEKFESHSHAVGHCDRCQTMIEPQVSKQWFVKVEPLAKKAIDVVNEGRIKIVPERFTKVYLNWMENIRDWCISRQLWWGHRIPVWYCDDCGEMTASVEQLSACSHCRSSNIRQDTDVLDTWFSSGLWPHSTMGWPEITEDLKYFYPTSVLVTGYDILFFWVARMIMMGLEDTDEIPFHTVYLNGLIRDEKGNKMSKMRGNVVSPTEVTDKYGTDALRFASTTGTTPGNDVNLGQQKLEAARNFANKLWNAARFVLQSMETQNIDGKTFMDATSKKPETIEDRWIISQLNRLILNVTGLMDDFQFGEAERYIHDFFWGEYCDWYIEMAKLRMSDTDSSPISILAHVLETTLRLLHPFMPFITEELWQNMKHRLPEGTLSTDSIMLAPYPNANEDLIDSEAKRVIESVIEIVHAIRNTRAERKVPAAKWIEAHVYTNELASNIAVHAKTIETLARAQPLSILSRDQRKAADEKAVVIVLKEAELVMPLSGMIDFTEEKKRLELDIAEIEKDAERLNTRLSDQAFISKAPQAVVDKERARLQTALDKLTRLRQELTQLTQ